MVTKLFSGICGMQVCAESDATDDEILAVCNRENPSGTTNGWAEVVREAVEGSMFKTPDAVPVTCANDPQRTHFVVLC